MAARRVFCQGRRPRCNPPSASAPPPSLASTSARSCFCRFWCWRRGARRRSRVRRGFARWVSSPIISLPRGGACAGWRRFSWRWWCGGLCSSLWAIEPHRSLLIALRLTGLFAAGLALIAASSEIRASRRLVACLLAGFALSLPLAAVQYATDGALTARLARRAFIEPTLNTIEDGFGLLLPPLCAALFLQRLRVVALLLAVPTVAVIFLLVGDAARIAFILGVAAAVPLYFRRKWVARAAAIALGRVHPGGPARAAAAGRDCAGARRRAGGQILGLASAGDLVVRRRQDRAEAGTRLGARFRRVRFPAAAMSFRVLHPDSNGCRSTRTMRPCSSGSNSARPERCCSRCSSPGSGSLSKRRPGRRSTRRRRAAAWSTALLVGFGSYGVWQEWWIATEFLTLFLILALGRVIRIK